MHKDNFLLIVNHWQTVNWFWLSLFGVGVGVLANISLLSVAIIFSVFFVIFLAKNIELGLVGILILGFFHSWEIDFGRYAWTRDISYLLDINAPVVDFLAVALLCAIMGAGFFQWDLFKEKIKQLSYAPGFLVYILFLGAVCISAYLAYRGGDILAFKFWLRPYVFVYAMFVLTFIFGVKNNLVFVKFWRILVGLGIVVAVFGAVSLIINQSDSGIWRVIPFGFFGFAPLGYNHNLLAEVLVATVPAFLMLGKLALQEKNHFYDYSLVFVVIIALLTLSRAAWLALAVTFGVWFWFEYKHSLKQFLVAPQQVFLGLCKKNKLFVIGGLLFFFVITAYMVYFLGTGTAISSTTARFDVARVVGLYVQRQPWFGYGPGSYIDVVGETAFLHLEYGDALDAHGFGQKIVLETGLIGLALFIFFLFVILRSLYRAIQQSDNDTGRIIFCGLLAMVSGSIVFQLFNTSYFNSVFWIPIGLASAALVHVYPESLPRGKNNKHYVAE